MKYAEQFWLQVNEKDLHEMTQEDVDACAHLLNAEIATELGWKFDEANNNWRRKDEELPEPPNYVSDLNLCQEIEFDLREHEEILYANILTSILNNGNIPPQGFHPCPIIFANAIQKCMSFLVLREKI